MLTLATVGALTLLRTAEAGRAEANFDDAILGVNGYVMVIGGQVQVSKCPNGHGKIKSPLCCGQDMTCSL